MLQARLIHLKTTKMGHGRPAYFGLLATNVSFNVSNVFFPQQAISFLDMQFFGNINRL